MGFVSTRRPWLRQPPQMWAIDRGLIGDDALVWTPWQRTVIAGHRGVVLPAGTEAGLALGPGPGGIYGATYTGTSGGVDFGLTQPMSSSAGLTYLVVGSPSSAASTITAVSQRKGSGGFEQLVAYFNTDGAGSPASGKMVLFCYSTSSTNCSVSADSAGIDGRTHCWVMAASSGAAAERYIYRDGLPLTLATSTALSGTFVSSGQKFAVGRHADATGGAFGAPLALVIAWPRSIPPALAQKLSENPWAAFVGPRRLWAVSTGGSVTGTLAATESGGDTSALSGVVKIAGTIAATESGSDTAALSGKVRVSGSIAATEGSGDTAALSGKAIVSGALAAAEGGDTTTVAGVVKIAGTIAATEASGDSAVVSGQVRVSGAITTTETGSDTAAINGSQSVTGLIAAIEAADTAAIVGEAHGAGVISLGGRSKRRESPAELAAMLDLAQRQEAEARDLRDVQEIIAAMFALEGIF